MSLILKNVSKTFEDTKGDVLNNINLEIQNGEFVCVVGQSGCGKSTLLNLIAGLEKPTSGEILLNGKGFDGPSANRVVMFQEHALFPWLNVIENVKFGMKLAGLSAKEQEDTAMKYLRMMQLEEYRDYAIHQLSGGMRQRVALARALTLDSEILLMDEPFSALDKQTSNRLRSELQEIWLKTKRTILFITHSVEEAVYLADRVIVISPAKNSIADVIAIDLERPRYVYDEKFVDYRHRILEEVQGNADHEKK
ncbi:MAG: ABC transporter ATP-binding protein [Dorea sp.]|nr:ABC transporter ATP-binding protein [Dorea sp.]